MDESHFDFIDGDNFSVLDENVKWKIFPQKLQFHFLTSLLQSFDEIEIIFSLFDERRRRFGEKIKVINKFGKNEKLR